MAAIHMTRLGLAAGLALALTALTACGGAEEDPAAQESMETLPVEKRVAFMSGHVEAGLALYRAGAPDQAAPHLLHPVSETHEAERAGIEALGFEQAAFIAVSEALEAGRPAEEIEPLLAAAEANMALMQTRAGGDPAEIIAYLMNVIDEEYAIGVTAGTVTDPGEYQDAYGFTLVAIDIARRMEDNGILLAELDALLMLWPDGGPLADSVPAPVFQVEARTGAVRNALAG